MRISSWISDVCSSYLALQFVEQGIDVAAQPVEFGDTERLHPLVEAAVQPHVMRDGRDFIERLDELIFEPPRQENRAECGDQQAGQSGEQAEPDIVDQRRAVAPDLDRPDRDRKSTRLNSSP